MKKKKSKLVERYKCNEELFESLLRQCRMNYADISRDSFVSYSTILRMTHWDGYKNFITRRVRDMLLRSFRKRLKITVAEMKDIGDRLFERYEFESVKELNNFKKGLK